jgi:hypothetical protein
VTIIQYLVDLTPQATIYGISDAFCQLWLHKSNVMAPSPIRDRCCPFGRRLSLEIESKLSVHLTKWEAEFFVLRAIDLGILRKRGP